MTNENTKDIRTNTEVESQVDERDDTVVAPIENTEDATDETTAEVVVSDDADKNGEVDTDSSEEAEAETEDEDDSSVAIVPMAKKGMTTREKDPGNKGDNDGSGSGDKNDPIDNNDGKDNNGNQGGNGDDHNKTEESNTDYSGETTVGISKIDANSGFVTITVDGTSVMVPVQTTVFNGRITKSGVAQSKIGKYSCGITVMIFYPESEGFNKSSAAGYMSKTTDSLTVLVDINGNDSKLMIKINGMKSLF